MSRGRPKAITDERILATARDVFLERGIRATASDVAARAGISEGTIFHRFKSKDALFRAAMQFDPDSTLARTLAVIPKPGVPDVRVALVALGKELLEVGRKAMPMMLMAWSNPTGEYALATLGERKARFEVATRALASFFEGEMKRGRLDPRDPDILARAFIGTLRDYCIIELLQPGAIPARSSDSFVEGVVDLVVRAPEPARRKRARSPKARAKTAAKAAAKAPPRPPRRR